MTLWQNYENEACFKARKINNTKCSQVPSTPRGFNIQRKKLIFHPTSINFYSVEGIHLYSIMKLTIVFFFSEVYNMVKNFRAFQIKVHGMAYCKTKIGNCGCNKKYFD